MLGGVLKGCWIEPGESLYYVFEQETLSAALVLVQPRKTCSNMIEKFVDGKNLLEQNKANSQ